jgi:hypothetical protein
MAKLTEQLKESIKSSISGGVKSKMVSPVKDESTTFLKIIGKNFLALPGIARDLNVARQNIQKLVSLSGEKPATGADAFFLKEDEKERALEASREREEAKAPKVVTKEKGEKGIFDKIKDMFSPGKFLRSFAKYFALTAIVGIIFVAFKDTFVEWVKGLYNTIKEKFDEFIEDIKNWFKETIQPVIDDVKSVFNNIVNKIAKFFTSIGEWISEKFAQIKEFFEPVVEFIKGVFDKFMGVIDKVKEGFQKFKDFIKPYVEDALDTPIVKYLPPVLALKALTGAKSPEEKKEKEKKKPVPVTPGYEEGAAADAMASGVEGEPYIPEPEAPPPKPSPPKPPAPTPAPTPAPAPSPAPAPVPTPAPAPITAEPPTPTGKAAEGPEKQVEGSLTSVVTVQSGVDMSGLHPEFKKRLTAMATAFKEETGKKLLITSAYRSNEKQSELFNAKLKEFGGDRARTRKLVAEPMAPLGSGRGSFHLKGLAIDINSKGPAGINVLAGDRENPTGWLEKFGLTRPVKKENWHIQPIGTLPTADNPVNPGAPTLVAGKDAKPMNLADGKKESLGQPEASTTSMSGSIVASASTDLAADQRAQQKPSTPIIINSPKTTNTFIQSNRPPTHMQVADTSGLLLDRAL